MYTVYESFMGKRIIADPSKYIPTVAARPDLKKGIDEYLTETGQVDLIIE